MNGTDWAIGVVAGLAGFGIVWWLFNIVRQQRTPPVEMFDRGPTSAPPKRAELSVAELGNTWHVILGVPPAASSAQIEAAYHARVAECDRIRFSADQSELDKQNAETRRNQIDEAYEFVRAIKR